MLPKPTKSNKRIVRTILIKKKNQVRLTNLPPKYPRYQNLQKAIKESLERFLLRKKPSSSNELTPKYPVTEINLQKKMKESLDSY